MKPRNKKECEITTLSNHLPKISEKQVAWAFEHCLPTRASLCKGELWCSECGTMWIAKKDIEKETECPFCGKKLKVEKSRRQKITTAGYMTIAKAVKGYQVLRHVYVEKTAFKGKAEVSKEIHEVCQQWFDEKGNETIIALPRDLSGNWFFSSKMSIKGKPRYYTYYPQPYNIDGNIYPRTSFIPLLRKYGLKSSFHKIHPSYLIKGLLMHEELVEYLFKTKQYSLLDYKMYRGSIGWFKKSVDICNRNHYQVKDGEMYADYLYLLRHFNLDLHNAFYVCPKDLRAAHDKLVKRKEKQEAELTKKRKWEEALKRKQMIKAGMRYYCSHIIPYMNLSFRANGITVRPLMNVAQFYQEAKNLHHCVWVEHYYNHENCLILTARKDDKVLETIEINTKTYQVVQVRGAWNHDSDYHNEIVDIVNNNMNKIRDCA